MTNDERLERIRQKLRDINTEMVDLYDFLAIIEALTTDKNTAERIRRFMEEKGLWSKIKS